MTLFRSVSRDIYHKEVIITVLNGKVTADWFVEFNERLHQNKMGVFDYAFYEEYFSRIDLHNCSLMRGIKNVFHWMNEINFHLWCSTWQPLYQLVRKIISIQYRHLHVPTYELKHWPAQRTKISMISVAQVGDVRLGKSEFSVSFWYCSMIVQDRANALGVHSRQQIGVHSRQQSKRSRIRADISSEELTSGNTDRHVESVVLLLSGTHVQPYQLGFR